MQPIEPDGDALSGDPAGPARSAADDGFVAVEPPEPEITPTGIQPVVESFSRANAALREALDTASEARELARAAALKVNPGETDLGGFLEDSIATALAHLDETIAGIKSDHDAVASTCRRLEELAAWRIRRPDRDVAVMIAATAPYRRLPLPPALAAIVAIQASDDTVAARAMLAKSTAVPVLPAPAIETSSDGAARRDADGSPSGTRPWLRIAGLRASWLRPAAPAAQPGPGTAPVAEAGSRAVLASPPGVAAPVATSAPAAAELEPQEIDEDAPLALMPEGSPASTGSRTAAAAGAPVDARAGLFEEIVATRRRPLSPDETDPGAESGPGEAPARPEAGSTAAAAAAPALPARSAAAPSPAATPEPEVAETTAPDREGPANAAATSEGDDEAAAAAQVAKAAEAAAAAARGSARRAARRIAIVAGIALILAVPDPTGGQARAVPGGSPSPAATPTPVASAIAAVSDAPSPALATEGPAATPTEAPTSRATAAAPTGRPARTASPEEIAAFLAGADVVARVETDRPVVALTFDDGFAPRNVRAIFRILEEEGVRATFFVNAIYVAWAPALWTEIAAAGHPIANHSYRHDRMTLFSFEQVRDDLIRNAREIRRMTGVDLQPWYRPPYGDRTPLTDAAAVAAGFPTIAMWDTSSADTSPTATAAQLLANTARATAGSIVLMHAGPDITPTVLREIIEAYRARGFAFVTFGELLDLRDEG